MRWKQHDPEVFDIERDAKESLNVGQGPHGCVGANPTRTEPGDIWDAVMDFLPRGATALHDQIKTGELGMFDQQMS